MKSSNCDIFGEKGLIMLLGLAYSILGNREDAEDVVQDVCARLLSKQFFPSLVRNPEAFAARSVMNACVDSIRRRKDKVDLQNIPEPVSVPENREDRELVRIAMAQLPDRQRLVVYLKDIAGYPTEEIAAMLSIPENHVRTMLSRARKSLRDLIMKNQNYGL